MKILFLVPYPLGEAPSQRFRFEQYFQTLQKNGHTYLVQCFLKDRDWRLLSMPGNYRRKALMLIRGYACRLAILVTLRRWDYVFIHREATPLGPPLIEWIAAKIFRKKIIYDFDDAIWTVDVAEESQLLRILKWRKKVSSICRWSFKISCGNEYLRQFALQHNKNAIHNPTTIDTGHVQPKNTDAVDNDTMDLTIGWTGSHSTLKYLGGVVSVLQSLEKKYPQVQFLIIADRDPDLPLQRYRFRKWNKEEELKDLAIIDIGIMPMPDDAWTRGKCGFKALQYMAMGIAAVISPVGVNRGILTHGVEGFLCSSPDDWFTALEFLITHPDKIKEMGRNGRRKVVSSYSVDSNSTNFLSLFQ